MNIEIINFELKDHSLEYFHKLHQIHITDAYAENVRIV